MLLGRVFIKLMVCKRQALIFTLFVVVIHYIFYGISNDVISKNRRGSMTNFCCRICYGPLTLPSVDSDSLCFPMHFHSVCHCLKDITYTSCFCFQIQ